METINGEWYMLCCSESDPDSLHTIGELKKLIKKIGFLPLFSNEIEGFPWRSILQSKDGGAEMQTFLLMSDFWQKVNKKGL